MEIKTQRFAALALLFDCFSICCEWQYFHSKIACYTYMYSRLLKLCVLQQAGRVDLAVAKELLRLHDCCPAAQAPIHIKGVFLECGLEATVIYWQ